MDRPHPGGRHRLTGDLTPQRKVGAGAISGTVMTVVLWLNEVNGVEIPASVSAALTLLVTAGIAYLIPGEGQR